MKNILDIDVKKECFCSLVTCIDDGTARLFLNIESDLSLNPKLEYGTTKTTLTKSPQLVEIASSHFKGTGTFQFRVVDDSRTGSYFSIKKIANIDKTLTLKQISEYSYEFSIYIPPITVQELEEQVNEVKQNVSTLDTNFKTFDSNFSSYKNSSDTHFNTLDKNVSNMSDDLDTLNENLTDMRNDFNSMSNDVNTLETNLNTANNNISSLNSKITTANNNINSLSSRVSDNESSIRNLIEDLGEISDDVKNIAKVIYPVGSIYMSTSPTNPSTYFGGTWVAWGSGRVPVGVSSGDSDFGSVEKTGGAKTHKLTTNEMPKHHHGPYYTSVTAIANDGTTVNKDYGWYTTAGSYLGYGMVQSGGDAAHNNLQPYITCYMWKRTK